VTRVLVTGGLGFIGSHLSNALHHAGHDVIIVDNLETGSYEFIDEELKENCLIWDYGSDITAALIAARAHRFDVVYHLGAVARVALSFDKPVHTTNMNVLSTVKLFDACRGNVGRIVFASSSSVYGAVDEDQLPITHTQPKHPRSPYALQKSFVEDYAKICCDNFGQDITSLRFFNVYGPGSMPNGAYATVLPAWFTAALTSEPLRLEGTGEQSRDMAYVSDVVRACMLAGDAAGKANGACMNVAGGQRVSLNDILQWFVKRYHDIKLENAPPRPGDIMHTEADMLFTKEMIGYKPSINFWDGLEKTAEWWEARLQGAKK